MLSYYTYINCYLFRYEKILELQNAEKESLIAKITECCVRGTENISASVF